MGRLTTHVLDTARGCPAAGMAYTLHAVAADGSRRLLCSGLTNHDGRAAAPLLEGDALVVGNYELVFEVAAYFAAAGVAQAAPPLPRQRASRLWHRRPRRPLPRAPAGVAVELFDLPGKLMDAYLIEWGSLLLRWLHLIVGIAWIGSSFYFVWLDNSLKPPVDPALKAKGVGGELWAVHGGGFYNPQKYLVAPAHLPDELHWFKWESYSTWLSGFALISTLYYFQAASYMVDPSVAALTPTQAVGIGLATLAGGWLVYDGLCRLLINRSQLLFGVIYYSFVVAVAWALTHLLSGRAAFIHVGAMIATTMSGNVFFWIIPGQKRVVAAMQKGAAPDPMDGIRAKQRSYHNNYLTLPVLFCMISNHYAFTYTHPHAWAVLALIILAAVLIRHFFNLKHKGAVRWEFPAAAIAILAGVAVWLAPAPRMTSSAAAPTLAAVQPIIEARCSACHAEKPTLMASAPAGVLLDTPARIESQAQRIYDQAVKLKAMPLGNVTGITDAERATLAAWFEGR